MTWNAALRCLLPAALAAALPLASHAQDSSPEQIAKLPYSQPTLTARYGTAPQQTGELRLPAGKGPFPVVVVVHGGCLLSAMETMQGTRALATALTSMGYATWNIEYRALDQPGGGWPGTYQDWGAAVNYLRVLAKTSPLRVNDVVTLGHSAGSPAALWLAYRARLPAGNEIRGAAPLAVRAAVGIDGPADLEPYVGFDARICGQPIVAPLLQGTPAEQPAHYAQTSPSALAPAGIPQLLIASEVLPVPFAQDYQAKLKQAGDVNVTLLQVKEGGHFDVIAPGSPVWVAQVQPALEAFLKRVTK